MQIDEKNNTLPQRVAAGDTNAGGEDLIRNLRDSAHGTDDPHAAAALFAAVKEIERLDSLAAGLSKAAAQPAKGEWVAVGDRTPESPACMVLIAAGGIRMEARQVRGRFFSVCTGAELWPTHWMHIPPLVSR